MMNIDRQSTDDTEDTFVTAETIKWSAWHHTMMKSGIAIDNGLWSCYLHPTNDDFPKFTFIIYSFCTCWIGWMAFLAFTASNMLSELMRLCFWITTLNPQLRILSIMASNQHNIITTLSIMALKQCVIIWVLSLITWTTNRRSLKTNHYHRTGRARSVHSAQPQISNNPFSTGQGGLNTMCRNGVAC